MYNLKIFILNLSDLFVLKAECYRASSIAILSGRVEICLRFFLTLSTNFMILKIRLCLGLPCIACSSLLQDQTEIVFLHNCRLKKKLVHESSLSQSITIRPVKKSRLISLFCKDVSVCFSHKCYLYIILNNEAKVIKRDGIH